jgi:hypothetical protein
MMRALAIAVLAALTGAAILLSSDAREPVALCYFDAGSEQYAGPC